MTRNEEILRVVLYNTLTILQELAAQAESMTGMSLQNLKNDLQEEKDNLNAVK
jgi:hypothetical protein